MAYSSPHDLSVPSRYERIHRRLVQPDVALGGKKTRFGTGLKKLKKIATSSPVLYVADNLFQYFFGRAMDSLFEDDNTAPEYLGKISSQLDDIERKIDDLPQRIATVLKEKAFQDACDNIRSTWNYYRNIVGLDADDPDVRRFFSDVCAYHGGVFENVSKIHELFSNTMLPLKSNDQLRTVPILPYVTELTEMYVDTAEVVLLSVLLVETAAAKYKEHVGYANNFVSQMTTWIEEFRNDTEDGIPSVYRTILDAAQFTTTGEIRSIDGWFRFRPVITLWEPPPGTRTVLLASASGDVAKSLSHGENTVTVTEATRSERRRWTWRLSPFEDGFYVQQMSRSGGNPYGGLVLDGKVLRTEGGELKSDVYLQPVHQTSSQKWMIYGFNNLQHLEPSHSSDPHWDPSATSGVCFRQEESGLFFSVYSPTKAVALNADFPLTNLACLWTVERA